MGRLSNYFRGKKEEEKDFRPYKPVDWNQEAWKNAPRQEQYVTPTFSQEQVEGWEKNFVDPTTGNKNNPQSRIEIPAAADIPDSREQLNITNTPRADKPEQVPTFDWYNQFVQSLKPPMTEEEQRKRERGAKVAEAIAHMGNIASAFGNLAFAAHSAPNQQIGGVEGADYTKWRDRIDTTRNNYAQAVMSAQRQKEADENLREQRQWERDYKERIANSNQDNKDRDYELKVQAAADKRAAEEVKQKQAERKQDFDEWYKKNQAVTARIKASKTGSGGSGSGSSKGATYAGKEVTITLPKTINASNLRTAFELAGGKFEDEYGMEKKITAAEQMTFIQDNMTPEVADYFRRIGGTVTYMGDNKPKSQKTDLRGQY